MLGNSSTYCTQWPAAASLVLVSANVMSPWCKLGVNIGPAAAGPARPVPAPLYMHQSVSQSVSDQRGHYKTHRKKYSKETVVQVVAMANNAILSFHHQVAAMWWPCPISTCKHTECMYVYVHELGAQRAKLCHTQNPRTNHSHKATYCHQSSSKYCTKFHYHGL